MSSRGSPTPTIYRLRLSAFTRIRPPDRSHDGMIVTAIRPANASSRGSSWGLGRCPEDWGISSIEAVALQRQQESTWCPFEIANSPIDVAKPVEHQDFGGILECVLDRVASPNLPIELD